MAASTCVRRAKNPRFINRCDRFGRGIRRRRPRSGRQATL